MREKRDDRYYNHRRLLALDETLPKIDRVFGATQNNTSDCGVYVLITSRLLASAITENRIEFDESSAIDSIILRVVQNLESLSPGAAEEFRGQIIQKIYAEFINKNTAQS